MKNVCPPLPKPPMPKPSLPRKLQEPKINSITVDVSKLIVEDGKWYDLAPNVRCRMDKVTPPQSFFQKLLAEPLLWRLKRIVKLLID